MRVKKKTLHETIHFILIIPILIIIFLISNNIYYSILNFIIYLVLQRIIVISITGGIACGKTQVSKILENKGYHIIDMDIISRQIVEIGKPAYNDIIKHFGHDILETDGRINRKLLKSIIFNDKNKRKLLNKITHYHIFIETLLYIIYYRLYLFIFKFQNIKLIIISPLLFESKIFTWLSSPIYVIAANKELQLKYLMNRDQCTKEFAESMINSQLNLDIKCKLADKIIWNNGTLEDLYNNVEKNFYL